MFPAIVNMFRMMRCSGRDLIWFYKTGTGSRKQANTRGPRDAKLVRAMHRANLPKCTE